jgi:hypothetical protein
MNKFILLIVFLVFNGEVFSQTKEMKCLNEYNSYLEKVIKKEVCKYESIADSLKFIIQVELNSNGEFSDIKILKSNLKDFSISENKVLNKLKKKKIRCLYDVYYSENLNPTSLVLIFNNKFIKVK